MQLEWRHESELRCNLFDGDMLVGKIEVNAISAYAGLTLESTGVNLTASVNGAKIQRFASLESAKVWAETTYKNGA